MIAKLIHTFRSQIFGGETDNRRRHRRVVRRTLLTILKLDGDLSKVGEPIWAISSDFSKGGIGFTCKHRIDTMYVRVTINEDNQSMIGVVRHTRLIDEADGTHFVCIQFFDDYHAHNGG